MPKRILRLPQVMERVGQNRSTIYTGVKNGTFPKPLKLSPRLIDWLESSIDDYLEALVEKSRVVTP